MGLDMYLSAKKHLSNYDFHPEEQELNGKIKEALGLDKYTDNTASIEVRLTVAYWRKANQIHNWFVRNVQGGTDDCSEYEVQRDQLQELLDTITYTLDTKDTKNLKPSAGFFFGSTDVDEWYWDELKATQSELTTILEDANLKDAYFYYQSSW